MGGTKWDISYFATTHFFPLLISALIFFFPVIISAIKAISSTWALDLFLSLYSFIFHIPRCTYLLLLSFPPWYKSKTKLKTSLIPISLPAIAFSQHLSSGKLCVLYTLILQSTPFYSLYPLLHFLDFQQWKEGRARDCSLRKKQDWIRILLLFLVRIWLDENMCVYWAEEV